MNFTFKKIHVEICTCNLHTQHMHTSTIHYFPDSKSAYLLKNFPFCLNVMRSDM